jgi:hypothetical protein
MKPRVRKVAGPSGLRWTVKRLVIPVGMRGLSPTEVLDAATPRRTVVEGQRLPEIVAPTGPVLLGFLLVPFALPFVPIALLLRGLRLLPWTVEARAYPWGRRFPPIVFSYEVRGRDESLRAFEELAEALARGDGAPVITGGERFREARTVHN